MMRRRNEIRLRDLELELSADNDDSKANFFFVKYNCVFISKRLSDVLKKGCICLKIVCVSFLHKFSLERHSRTKKRKKVEIKYCLLKIHGGWDDDRIVDQFFSGLL